MATATTTACNICFEDYTADQVVAFDCRHGACAPCWTQWFTSCETKGLVAPFCIVCRGPVEAEALLGRPYHAVEIFTAAAVGKHGSKDKLKTKDLDDCTTSWLIQHEARGCHDCGAWITRADGSNAATCLCGNRLCWECDGEGDECLCVQLTHVYQNSAAYSPETIVAEDVKPSATPLISTETSDIKASPVYAKKEEAAPEPFVDVAVGELPSDEETRSENKVATHRLSCRFAADDIWTACKMGDLEYVQQALQAQPHLLMAEYNGRTPLFLASLCGQATVVDFLLSRGALDPGGICYQSALGDACRSRLKRASRQQQQHQGVKVKPSPSSATSLRRRPRRAGRTRMPSTQPGQSPLRVRGCLLY